MKLHVWIGCVMVVGAAVALGALTEPDPGKFGVNPQAVTPAVLQEPWRVMRTVTASDTASEPNTKDWTTIKTNWYPVNPRWTRVEMAFFAYGDGSGGGDPNAGRADFKVMACTAYGSAKTVYQGYLQIGELELSHNPDTGAAFRTSAAADPNYKWADYIEPNGVGDVWVSDVIVVGNSGADTSGEMAVVDFRLCGFYGLWCEVTLDGGITSLKVMVRGY